MNIKIKLFKHVLNWFPKNENIVPSLQTCYSQLNRVSYFKR